MQNMREAIEATTRRNWLRTTAQTATGLLAGAWVGSALMADSRIAARIEEAPSEHPLVPALQMAARSRDRLDAVEDYEATFVKSEVIGRRLTSSRMKLKLREKPFSVYLKFLEPHAGREVLYVANRNGGKLLVHEVGLASLVGTISLDPNGKLAMEENRYPLTMLGMRTMVDTVMQQWLSETKLDDISVNYFPKARVGKLHCKVIESTHASRRPETKFQMTRLYLDADSGLPIRVQQYGFPARQGDRAPLIEDYLYLDLETNVDLEDIDFDPSNARYGF
ncbi:hypothetical protein Mal4_24960 [Maioricimonas rarisocia]|uniref:DUF1571 domain-containing protein n=1 Tax=Maioricimonas rarisocia TaxID=2528026 RepID=A0A517Z6R0_9PLAN|nr:DUF1571 domain-containing protein [Maioricimonas rarisocia]QDU38173.1 hypothetical protein Mal4_24960 [Maioricimonas rarisocia]